MDLRPYIDKFAKRLAEVEAALSDPAVFDNKQRAQELSRPGDEDESNEARRFGRSECDGRLWRDPGMLRVHRCQRGGHARCAGLRAGLWITRPDPRVDVSVWRTTDVCRAGWGGTGCLSKLW